LISGRTVKARLTVSIVTFAGDVARLKDSVEHLAVAVADIAHRILSSRICLIDNGPYSRARSAELGDVLAGWQEAFEILAGHGNIGYGRGHNLAIARATSEYHLVLNPDVELAPDSLANALAFMDAHPACGLLAPATFEEDGSLQFLCKRHPTVLDLLLRGFAPGWLRRRFQARLDRYEMRDAINERDVVWDPPIVSGCFMLFRTEVLRKLGGFDPRFFLYFEDFDLSLRTAKVARIAYVPSVRIVHHGGGAARKGLRHVRMFVTSAVKFFNKHGWRWVGRPMAADET
jgi:GT2 family glycosyltransferase